MGTFTVTIQVGDLAGQQFIEVEAPVDTGATYTVLPASTLRQLGIEAIERRLFRLADERTIEYPVADARVRLDGGEHITLVVFGPEDAAPLVGAVTLETFGLGVDPVGQRLIPVAALLKQVWLWSR